MNDEFILVTNPVKYKPHHDTIIKAECSTDVVKIILNNTTSLHGKISYVYNGIRYYDDVSYVKRDCKVQFYVECEDGYMVEYVYINSEKYNAGILGQDIVIEADTLVSITENIRKFYANFEAAYNSELYYTFVLDGTTITKTLHGGEHESYLVPHGTEVDVGYSISQGFNGELRKSDVYTADTHFTVSGEDLWLATHTDRKTYTVRLYYVDNGKLEVTYTDDYGEVHSYETGDLADPTKITEYFTIGYGYKLKLDVSYQLGSGVSHIYINETLDVPNHYEHMITGNTRIKAIIAEQRQNVIIKKSSIINNAIIYNGAKYDYNIGKVSVKYGDYIYFDMIPVDSFKHYVKAVKINEVEFPGLESYQVLEDLSIDSVAGDNVYAKTNLIIKPVLNGKIYVYYIDKEYTSNDSPLVVLENYIVTVRIKADAGHTVTGLTIDGFPVPYDQPVAYKIIIDDTSPADIVIDGTIS